MIKLQLIFQIQKKLHIIPNKIPLDILYDDNDIIVN